MINLNDTNNNQSEPLDINSSSLARLFINWTAERDIEGFNALERLIEFSECMERELNEFWGRDPDPFDERPVRKIPSAGSYATVSLYLLENGTFIVDLIEQYVLNAEVNVDNECRRATLRFLCNVLNCVCLSEIFTQHDADKERFCDRIFSLARTSIYPLAAYAVCIIGYMTKDDDQLILHRKSAYAELIGLCMTRLKHLNSIKTGPLPKVSSVDDQNSNTSATADLSITHLRGLWNLAQPLKETMEQRLIIFFLRYLADFEDMMPFMYTKGILTLIVSWVRASHHDDIRLMFEALRLLMRLLCHRCIYIEFFDRHKAIELLMSVSRPSVAADAVSYCLYNLLYHAEVMDKFVLMPDADHREVMFQLLCTIETCHPQARSYALMTVQCLLRHRGLLAVFESLGGPRYVLNLLAMLPNLLCFKPGETTRKDATYFNLLRTAFTTMKVALEQSIIAWADDLSNSGGGSDCISPTDLVIFPIKNGVSLQPDLIKAVSLVMYHQTWKHPYISDRSVISVVYSQSNPDESIFKDAFSGLSGYEIIPASLDVLSLLCLSNKFLGRFLDFQQENNTKATVKMIFNGLLKRPPMYNKQYIRGLRSMLFFVSVLCCRPLQLASSRILAPTGVAAAMGSCTTPAGLNNSSSRVPRKRKLDENQADNQLEHQSTAKRVHLSVGERGDGPITVSSATSRPSAAASSLSVSGTNTHLQTRIWGLATERSDAVVSTFASAASRPPAAAYTFTGSTAVTANVNAQLQTRLWGLIRAYNLIPRLLKLIESNFPQLDEVSIWTWTCHVLSGMARSADIRAMLQKLPVFRRDVLQNKMRAVVTPEKMREQAEFCQVAQRLISQLCDNTGVASGHSGIDSASGGWVSGCGRDLRPAEVRRAEIVSRTQIHWDKRELLGPIFQFLQENNFVEEARCFFEQQDKQMQQSSQPDSPALAQEQPPPAPKTLPNSSTTKKSGDINLYQQESSSQAGTVSSNKGIVHYSGPASNSRTPMLEDLMESYYRSIHAQCANPSSICTRFSLKEKHQCPDYKTTGPIQHNIIRNLMQREVRHTRENATQMRHYVHRHYKACMLLRDEDVFEDDRFAESFCFAKSLDAGLFFSSRDMQIVFADLDMNLAPVEIGRVNDDISNLEGSRDGRLLMVSSSYNRRFPGGPICLYDVSTRVSGPTKIRKLRDYRLSGYTEFGKSGDTSLLVTQDRQAHIVDTETGETVLTCNTDDPSFNPPFPRLGSGKNVATFSYNDNLVLHYGALWDVRCAKSLSGSANGTDVPVQANQSSCQHRFDNLEDIFSGVFHPNGLEIIIGSAVWDIRSYRLLQNIPALKSNRIVFNTRGDFFYTYQRSDRDLYTSSMIRGQNLFQCYDSSNYSVVSTVNTNKVIQAMCVDPSDLAVAVLEACEEEGSAEQCRVYSTGFRRSWSVDGAGGGVGGRKYEEEDDEDEEDDGGDRDDDDDDDDHEYLHDDEDDDASGYEMMMDLNDILLMSDDDDYSQDGSHDEDDDDEDNYQMLSDAELISDSSTGDDASTSSSSSSDDDDSSNPPSPPPAPQSVLPNDLVNGHE